jgi:hypothetical protein
MEGAIKHFAGSGFTDLTREFAGDIDIADTITAKAE